MANSEERNSEERNAGEAKWKRKYEEMEANYEALRQEENEIKEKLIQKKKEINQKDKIIQERKAETVKLHKTIEERRKEVDKLQARVDVLEKHKVVVEKSYEDQQTIQNVNLSKHLENAMGETERIKFEAHENSTKLQNMYINALNDRDKIHAEKTDEIYLAQTEIKKL